MKDPIARQTAAGIMHTPPAGAVTGPLGPGDDDPQRPSQGTAAPVQGPLGPGDSVPNAPMYDADEVVAPQGPGDMPAGAQPQLMGDVTGPLGPGAGGPEPPPRAPSARLKTKYDKQPTGA